MARTITLDPITRIEGHLRIDAEVDDHRITKAWASAQMWRGIETILRGRDPQDAWFYAQRLCGVCTTVHAISSIRAVEHALGAKVPLNAHLVRNIMIAQHSVQDHLVHFYHLGALDWVDVLAALKADPAKAAATAQSLSDWPGNSRTELAAVQHKLQGFVNRGQLGIFAAGYWGHPGMALSPELNLIALAHYLTSLDYQRKAAQAIAVFGGKNPHIQNLVVGGIATALDPDGFAALNVERLRLLRSVMEETRAFVQQVYFQDLLAIAEVYKDWFHQGKGVTNYLAVPEFPEDTEETSFALMGGLITDGNLDQVRFFRHQHDDFLVANIRESVACSWYEDKAPLAPWDGQTEPHYTDFQPAGKYSWCKAPRLAGRPIQVGPLAQVLLNYLGGIERVRQLVDRTNNQLGISLRDYHSSMGRLVARGIRACIMADLSLEYLDKLERNLATGDKTYANPTPTPGGEFRGVGFHEAPRGTLSHWVVIKDAKIANYQAVVPSTWNASPRDESGQPGPYEAALTGQTLAQVEQPLEILRTLHSFDPCVACAVHALDPEGAEIVRVKVL